MTSTEPDQRPPVRRVLAYYAYKATKAVELYRPVMYLYLLSAGLTFTEIAAVEAVYNLATVLGEVPTGWVGDRVGRRNSLLSGTAVIAGTLVALGFATSFLAFCLLFACWSTGYNFRSGSEDAWLYDTLADFDAVDEFARIRGRGESVALLVGAVGAVAGGYLGGLDLRYPFFAAAGVTALGLFALLAVPEPDAYERSGSASLSLREGIEVARDAVSASGLRAFVLYYYVLFSAVSYLVFIFLQPTFELAAVDLGLPRDLLEPALGWFYAFASLLSAGLAYRTGWLRDRVGLDRWFAALPLAVGGGLLALAAVPALALPALLLSRVVVEPTRALASQYVNDRVSSHGRATVLSALAMVSALAVIPFQLGGGLLSDAVSPPVALGVAGAALVAGSLAVRAWEPPIGAERAVAE